MSVYIIISFINNSDRFRNFIFNIIIIYIIINLLFQTIVHMDIKKNIYKTHIINKLKIIRINGNQ